MEPDEDDMLFIDTAVDAPEIHVPPEPNPVPPTITMQTEWFTGVAGTTTFAEALQKVEGYTASYPKKKKRPPILKEWSLKKGDYIQFQHTGINNAGAYDTLTIYGKVLHDWKGLPANDLYIAVDLKEWLDENPNVKLNGRLSTMGKQLPHATGMQILSGRIIFQEKVIDKEYGEGFI